MWRAWIPVLLVSWASVATAGDPAVAASRKAREKARRQAGNGATAGGATKVKVVMNEDLPIAGDSLGLVAPNFDAEKPYVSAPSGEAVEAGPESPGVGPLVDEEEVHDEEYWRDQMQEAVDRIRVLREDIEYARRMLFVLRLGLIVPGDPMREFTRRSDTDEVMQLLAALEAELVEAQAEPARIREKGRRERALPGWFR